LELCRELHEGKVPPLEKRLLKFVGSKFLKTMKFLDWDYVLFKKDISEKPYMRVIRA